MGSRKIVRFSAYAKGLRGPRLRPYEPQQQGRQKASSQATAQSPLSPTTGLPLFEHQRSLKACVRVRAGSVRGPAIFAQSREKTKSVPPSGVPAAIIR